jgi:BirA family biotin operon repressor/biotin-[acetyl-CoA-carboxylase] ligase
LTGLAEGGLGGFHLGEAARAAGHGLLALDEASSTNAVAWNEFREGRSGPLWIVAARQTAGRGRRGAAWSTPPGNLAASLLMTIEVPIALAATLGFVAGVALARAIEALGAPVGLVALKWPNDLVAGGAKLAGILLESEVLEAGRCLVVIGFGVNVAVAPEGLPYPAASLAALGVSAGAPALFAALTDAWAEELSTWDGGHGLAAMRRRWLARAAGLGAPIAVRSGGTVQRGVFETIDERCALVLRREDGVAAIVTAGEVHFGQAATARP